MKKIIILAVVAVLVATGGYLAYQNFLAPVRVGDEEARACVVDEDCIVFGRDGDCNCGCFNKNVKWERGGDCFCAAPAACRCVDGQCEAVFSDGVVSDPEKVVREYLLSTLGTLPGASVDYRAARDLLTPEFQSRFDTSSVPQIYCVQDGPADIRISESSPNSEMNWTLVTVEAEYGGGWQEMWRFKVVPVEGGEWRILNIDCLNN